ncbi:LOW QUALITY PROTEIN: mastermind-like protein 3 [Perognathus longimembris pacificus]|uniref:LOW QUALITY PROTEIN: mastermind-like protein 3 n=1 Tax=Perognathus longimembris pacificus TaxID=214514 RepID=UPI0020191A2A|nr:LOW QUALITY PROTEIN: mastermind-like protein 3 [Perognathus longimembris pacificus]
MGDFAAPAAPAAPPAANGSSICLNSSSGGGGGSLGGLGGAAIGGAGVGAGAPGGGAPAGGVPKHSTVVERLRQRIEGCRRHHVNCENRYQQAQVEQLELERRDTVSLYQRTLEQRAKKPGAAKQQHPQPHPQQHPNKPQQDAEAGSAEQRNHTLIMLQETVKRKLEGARSPLNGDQQNGTCDGSFSPTSKRVRKDLPAGMDALHSLPNNSVPLPSASPLHQLDLKPPLPLQNSGTHAQGLLEDLSKNGRLPEIKLPVNGCGDLENSFGLKQEPLDDAGCLDPSETSLSNQNKLFSDINLNDQEWQELIDELANTVPEDDIQDLFNEDFEEKKEPEFAPAAAAAETPPSQESVSVPGDPSPSPFPHVSAGSPQARPASSGPPFAAVSAAASHAAGSPAHRAARSPQTPSPAHAPGQAPYLLNPAAAVAPGPGSDMSPAEQLKQMAAQQQHRAKLMQHKPPPHSGRASGWSPLGPPSGPYGAAFTPDTPNSPMVYPQAFNSQNPIVPPMANNLQKTPVNNYLPPNPMAALGPPPNNLGPGSLNKPHSLLSYGNTKPLTHFNADLSQRMTPPMANPSKNPLMPYIQQPPPPQQSPQPPPPLQAPRAHLSEDQKRMLLLKQKGAMGQPLAYAALPSHGQEQHPVGLPRAAGPVPPSAPPGSGGGGGMVSGGSPVGPGFLGSQPQAALMKQMLLEQRTQLMEQQKQQFLREQRQQQQQQQLLAEQQLHQTHLPRQHAQQPPPPPQRSPYPMQQVGQFQGSAQDMAAARSQAALQSMRTSRMMAQNAGLMAMGPSQSPGTMGAAAAQSEMGLAPYSAPAAGQPGLYAMGPGLTQMLQHPSAGALSAPHGPAPAPRPPASGPGVGVVGGFAQSMLVGAQHPPVKGAGGQAPARPQGAPRLQTVPGTAQQGAPGWQPRGLSGLPGRAGAELAPFANGPGYALQAGPPRLAAKPPFPGPDAGPAAGRALHPAALARPLRPPLPGPQGAPAQARPGALAGLSAGVAGLPAFGPPSAQPQGPAGGGGGGYAGSGQSPAYERPPQDAPYGYGEGAAPAFPGLPDGAADLVDSLAKGAPPPGDEWMQELDELFGNP